MKEHRFQVNLGGMIDLLSNHLYSSPRVYIREVLQNSVDALNARRMIDPSFEAGTVHLEVIQNDQGNILIIQDSGIGLTEDEVHQFLATIGQSSKRDLATGDSGDFIGQFGIGLLSCFMVSEEIVVISRSARYPEAPAIEWRGQPDGTYHIKQLSTDLSPGTKVYLTAKTGYDDLFEPDTVHELAAHFGGLLPFPITLTAGHKECSVNTPPPWRDPSPTRSELKSYGEQLFGEKYFDAIPLSIDLGAISGTAYVLSHSAKVGKRLKNRVYIKGMLITEKAENLLPDWAFFVRCIIDGQDLRPTASRDDLYEDEKLHQVRELIGRELERYLVTTAENDPETMTQLMALHYQALMALCSENEDLLNIFFDWLPFETSLGRMTGKELRQQNKPVHYVTSSNRYRQVSRIASAQSLLVVNAGYTYIEEILQLSQRKFKEISCQSMEPTDLMEAFEDPAAEERARLNSLMTLADSVLRPYGLVAEIKRFEPADLPVIYMQNDSFDFMRSVERTKEVTDSFFASMLDNISASAQKMARARLCMNIDNELIQKIAVSDDQELQAQLIEMFYVQALLLGQYPLGSEEMKILNKGIANLISHRVS